MATIEKRPGKYGVAWRATVRTGGRRVNATFDTKADALAWAAATERAIRAGEPLPGESPPGDCRLSDATAEYLRHLGGRRLSQNTLRVYAQCAARLEAAFSGATLAGISRADVMRYRDARLAVVGPASVRHDLVLLRGIYRHARLLGGVDIPCPTDEVPAPPPPKNREPLLSLAEIQRLLDYCCAAPAPLLYSYVHLMLLTAMRPSEAAALRWEQVRPDLRMITLTRTKTGGRRNVPLSREALALLARLRVEMCGEMLFFPDANAVPPLPSQHFKGSFARACANAGLPGITLYSLRHIAASYLLMRGADIRTVAEIMGHANISTTMRYTHLLDAHKLAAVDRLEGFGG